MSHLGDKLLNNFGENITMILNRVRETVGSLHVK